MDEIAAIADIVYRLGFPAAVAVALLWFAMSTLVNRMADISDRVDALGERIEANTRAVTYLAVVLARVHGVDPGEMRAFVPGARRDDAQP